MVPVLLFLPLLAVSQVCTCYDTDAQGHWQPDNICQTCGFTAGVNPVQYEGPRCQNLPLRVNWPTAAYYCNGANDGIICNNYVVAGTLIAGGTCANRTSCLCSGNRAGSYCEKCSPGWAGYPACTTPACNATSCNNGAGLCQDVIPCGLTSCNPTTSTCQIDTNSAGQRFYTCRPLTASPCAGSGTASARHLGVAGGFTAPAVGCSSAGPYQYTPGVTVTVAWSCVGKVNGEAACCPAETTVCRGNANTIPPLNEVASCCKKSQTCCNGVCCGSDQVCKALPTPPGGWKYAAQYTCTTSYLTNISAIRVVVIPLFLLIAFIIVLALSVRFGAPASLTIPAIIIGLLCIFVLFSPNWIYAVLIILATTFTLGSSKAKSQNKYLYAFIFLVIVVAILLGGLGLGALWVQSGDTFFPSLGNQGFNAGGTVSSKGSYEGFQSACAQYYNYFIEDPYYLRPYTTDVATGQNYWGYCDQKWLAAQSFFYVLIIVFLLILTVNTAFAYGNDEAAGAPAGKGDTL